MNTNPKMLFLVAVFSLCSVLVLLSVPAYAQTPTEPDKPSILQAFDVSPTRIDLFWSTPQNDGGSSIIGYKIQFKTVEGSYSTLVTNTGNSTTKYSHTGLTTGTTYIYQVSAINSKGTSNPSPEAVATPKSSSTPLEQIPPNSPTSLNAVDISPTSIKLTWVKPATNDGPPVSGYKIEFKTESGAYSTLIAHTQNTGTTYTHTGLTTNTKYTYKVSAINTIGTGSSSNESSATPKSSSAPPAESIVPNSPRSLRAEPTSPTQISLSWLVPTDNNGPSVTGYKIEYKTSGNYTQIATTGPITSYVHDGLNDDTLYTYRIYAVNSVGDSSPSSTSSAKPAHTIIPTNLIATDISPTSILLTWKAPSQTYGGSITGYTISKELAPGVYDTVKDTNDKTTKYTVTGLTTGKTYTFVVSARYNIGTSSDISHSATATPTLLSKPPSTSTIPNPPTSLVATAVSPIQIDLNWAAPTFDGDSTITGYRIDVKVGNSDKFEILKQNTGSTARTYSHTDRTTDTKYTYKVFAINSIGTSGPSNEASATPTISATPPTPKEKPSPPISLVATAVSENQINLSWKIPTNDGGAPITGYKIEVKKGNGDYVVLASNTGKNTQYTHTGVTADTNYQYKVYSINAIGTSTSSATTSATTQAEDPEPVSVVPNFVDPKLGAQYYLDRYNNEPAYKDWFDTNFPDYTIEQAIELAIPDAFPEPDSSPEPKPTKPLASFVDPKKDPQHYIDRYNNEPTYKDWFDTNFPDYTIYEAVGVEDPSTLIGTCGPGTILVGEYCVAEKQTGGGGCLIATAAFGSELAPQVQMLRELRDNTVLSTTSGTVFMTGFNQFYYSFSPTIADWERENPVFQDAVRIAITPLLTSLSVLNYVDIDSEEEMLGYGISLIILNLGMYFVAPAIAILTIKRRVWNKAI